MKCLPNSVTATYISETRYKMADAWHNEMNTSINSGNNSSRTALRCELLHYKFVQLSGFSKASVIKQTNTKQKRNLTTLHNFLFVHHLCHMCTVINEFL